MQFIPELQLGWLNGWVLLACFYVLFGLFLLSCPKPIVKKLYSVKGWSNREYILSAIGKPYSLACFALVIMSPLKIGSVVFWTKGPVDNLVDHPGLLQVLETYSKYQAVVEIRLKRLRYNMKMQKEPLFSNILENRHLEKLTN